MRVELLANATTGLAAADLFYFGNVIGDVNVGNTSTRIRVNALDVSLVRSNLSTLPNSVSVSNPFDINRDGRVDDEDVNLVRANQQASGIVAPITAPNISPPPPLFTLQSKTKYLTDSANPTGYSQVLEETEFNASGVVTKKIVYTIGHDQISQTTLTPATTGTDWTSTVAYFGTDGHGSVRVLYDLAGAIVRDQSSQTRQQLYTFDAYGNLLGWNGAQPLTTYLYSGESFDFNIGQQYLRARFYDATTGRFNRLDPFFGNSSDPQSFHKYAYVHGDPIQGIDPTGMFLQQLYLQAKTAAANVHAYIGIRGFLYLIAGTGLTMAGGLAMYDSYSNEEYIRSGKSYYPTLSSPFGKDEGEFYLGHYLHQIKVNADLEDWETVRQGCVGLLRVRLGRSREADIRSKKNEPHLQVKGTRGFTTFEQAERIYNELKGKGGSPWLYAVQYQTAWKRPRMTNVRNGEIDVSTLRAEGTNFNYASMLFLPGGKKAWEDAPSGFTSQGINAIAKRTPFNSAAAHKGLAPCYTEPGVDDFITYYLVSPSHDTSLKY